AGANAYFRADQRLTVERDDIQFTTGAAPVARDDPAARALEQRGGNPLATRTDCRIARRGPRHRAAMPETPVGTSTGTLTVSGQVRAATAAAWTGAKRYRWMGDGPITRRAARCVRVPYPLCRANS